MRTAVGVLTLVYGAVAGVVYANVAFAAIAAGALASSGIVVLLGLAPLAMAVASVGLFCGGLGILAGRDWGPRVTHLSAIIITLGTFGYFFLMAFGESLGPGTRSSFQLIALASLKATGVAGIPMFAIWWYGSTRSLTNVTPTQDVVSDAELRDLESLITVLSLSGKDVTDAELRKELKNVIALRELDVPVHCSEAAGARWADAGAQFGAQARRLDGGDGDVERVHPGSPASAGCGGGSDCSSW